MLLLLILVIGFYLYKTGELQNILNKIQGNGSNNSNEARRIIDIRFAKGEISAEEYNKLKNIL
ncbi:hypothetical protein TEPIDINF_000176 [Tepidibacillus infernus]|uniref:SHOCT domain-containing protein n=1 Tax=Tepidibacillus decaturensis TaxID=1413211 RepID=A0A135L1M4_9BACI|nr:MULTISPECIES: hypothetical protein [Tepidibacillus]KXG42924.1 hypothetical protein U473_01940 [Tepidibacillus decaturensis]GBF10933.1 hypothetical protein HK1_00949 [Tepidibacillus sp. HK-1]